jgi:hypothetical protein
VDVISFADVQEAARGVGTIACFRSLPVVGFVLFTRTIRLVPKVVVATLLLGSSIALRAWTLQAAAALGLAYAYFMGVAALMPAAIRGLREGRITRGALFVAGTSAFLGWPCLLLPDSARSLALILGWDFVLSSYSYCVEKARTKEAAPPSEGLFFVLVNPSLVYVHRGRRIGSVTFRWRGAARALLGLTLLFVASAVLTPLCRALAGSASASSSLRNSVLAWALFGFLRFLLEYWRQSGLASVQIGLLLQLGHEIPERYRWPLLASDPLDFWRRWNTYVGGWVLRYVFWPTAARHRGTGRTWRLPAAQLLALVGTFAAVGLLHDVYAYAVALDTDWESSSAFVVMGVLVALWGGIPRAYRAIVPHAAGRGSRLGLRVLSRAGFWIVAVGWAAWGWR